MVVKQNVLTPELFLRLYTSVGWEPPGIDQVRAALEHIVATFTVFDSDSPIGMHFACEYPDETNGTTHVSSISREEWMKSQRIQSAEVDTKNERGGWRNVC